MGGDIEFRQTVPGRGGTANCFRKMSMPYAQKSTVSRVTVVFQRCKESERDPPISAGVDGFFVYQRLYKSCEYLQYLQYLQYLHEAHKHTRGSQKKLFNFRPSQDCSMRRKRRITLRFHKCSLLSSCLQDSGYIEKFVLSAAKRRTKTKEVPAGFKDETLRRPADLTTTERALATRRCRRDVTVTLFAFSRAH